MCLRSCQGKAVTGNSLGMGTPTCMSWCHYQFACKTSQPCSGTPWGMGGCEVSVWGLLCFKSGSFRGTPESFLRVAWLSVGETDFSVLPFTWAEALEQVMSNSGSCVFTFFCAPPFSRVKCLEILETVCSPYIPGCDSVDQSSFRSSHKDSFLFPFLEAISSSWFVLKRSFFFSASCKRPQLPQLPSAWKHPRKAEMSCFWGSVCQPFSPMNHQQVKKWDLFSRVSRHEGAWHGCQSQLPSAKWASETSTWDQQTWYTYWGNLWP